MKQTFIRRSLALASFLVLAGCAQDSGPRPSYIGLMDLTSNSQSETDATPSDPPSEAARYVQSNKILGAMAFHRVTGRTIDPSSLARP
jgi:hypothetical protein